MSLDLSDLKLSVLRGLLGNVSSKLRVVCASVENGIEVNFYFDGEISEEDNELAEHAIDQIIGDYIYFDKEKQVKFKMPIIRIDYPKKMPLRGDWVFYRYEDSSKYID